MKKTNVKRSLITLFLVSLTQVGCSDPGSIEAINSASPDRRNIVGIEITNPTDMQKVKSGCQEGVYVGAVIHKHPADIAGIKAGDFITEIASTPVRDISEALMAMDGLEAGTKYPFKVCRRTQGGIVTMEKSVLIEKVQERAIGKIS